MKYKLRVPEEFEAIQCTATNFADISMFLYGRVKPLARPHAATYVIAGLDVRDGDWLVKKSEKTVFRLTPREFDRDYVPVIEGGVNEVQA